MTGNRNVRKRRQTPKSRHKKAICCSGDLTADKGRVYHSEIQLEKIRTHKPLCRQPRKRKPANLSLVCVRFLRCLCQDAAACAFINSRLMWAVAVCCSSCWQFTTAFSQSFTSEAFCPVGTVKLVYLLRSSSGMGSPDQHTIPQHNPPDNRHFKRKMRLRLKKEAQRQTEEENCASTNRQAHKCEARR